jgi:hypothetical protein
MEEAERPLNTTTGCIVWKGTLRRGTPARELGPSATYRLGVDIEEISGN